MPPNPVMPPPVIPIPPPLTAEEAAQPPHSGSLSLDATSDDLPEAADPRIRSLLGLDMAKEETPASSNTVNTTAPAAPGLTPQPQATVTTPVKPNQKLHPQPLALSPARHPYTAGLAASPSRLRSSSPRLHSPASSEIFERNVQEPVPLSALQGELDQAHVPAHMITEDHIPPALEASAQAITSNDLDADDVEIVTSTAHLPAAASVIEASSSHAELPQVHSPPSFSKQPSDGSEHASFGHQSGFLPTTAEDDGASTYGQLDPNDVRRLSFISFADVVQSEHQHAPSSLREMNSRDSLSLTKSGTNDRTASPLRSPRSPGSVHSGPGVVTPPSGTGINPFNGELSPARSAISQHGELTIETMRQAVRKTASGDLGASRGAGFSPVSDETSLRDRLEAGRANS